MAGLFGKSAVDVSKEPLLTNVAIGSLSLCVGLAAAGFIGAKALKPRTRTDYWTAVWLIYDGLTHLIMEGSFLWYSVTGNRVATSTEPLAYLWKLRRVLVHEADLRMNPTVVSLEILTVLIGGPLCLYIAGQIGRNDPARHFWIVVLSASELYGGWMTFAPEWLTGSPNLVTDTFLKLWVYLFFMNMLWVVIPVWLLVISYREIATGLRSKVKSS